jgi:hypothetical protein
MGALLLALTFIGVDSCHRMRSIAAITSVQPGTAVPAPDATTTSGYEHNQHRLILPAGATDGYHWVLQTERMLAGDGVRIRRTDVDNAPYGRDVHWSGPVRWWLGAVAAVQSALRPNVTLARGAERSAAWANTLLLALLLVVGTLLVSHYLGNAAATLFALAWALHFPLYELFMVGILDHHGVAAMACFGGLLLLATGSTRRRFAAAGVISGLGMWISASTMIPVLAATGVAAVAAAAAAGPAGQRSALRDPSLWRAWAVAGAATSTAAWLVEYAPLHLGVRLEVNHPLYALAWLGGGELVARAVAATALRDVRQLTAAPVRLAAAVLALLLPALVIGAADTAVFNLADPFLRELHHAHIHEFQGLASQLATASLLDVLLQGTTILPILLVPMAALLSRTPTLTGRLGQLLRASLLLTGAVYLHATLFTAVRGLLFATGLDAAARHDVTVHMATLLPLTISLFALYMPLTRDAAEQGRAAAARGSEAAGLLPHGDAARLLLPAVPAVLLLWLTLGQVRWLSIAVAAMLALLVAAAALAPHAAMDRRIRLIAGAALVLAVMPLPLLSALLPWRTGYPVQADVPQLVARDAAHWLRERETGADIVVAAPPTTTTWLIWFGGVRGIGTLYWENLEGLRDAAAIFDAPDADTARRLLTERGATHLVVPAWELSPPRWLQQAGPPDWLVRLPYAPPAVPGVALPPVVIFEVQ